MVIDVDKLDTKSLPILSESEAHCSNPLIKSLKLTSLRPFIVVLNPSISELAITSTASLNLLAPVKSSLDKSVIAFLIFVIILIVFFILSESSFLIPLITLIIAVNANFVKAIRIKNLLSIAAAASTYSAILVGTIDILRIKSLESSASATRLSFGTN